MRNTFWVIAGLLAPSVMACSATSDHDQGGAGFAGAGGSSAAAGTNGGSSGRGGSGGGSAGNGSGTAGGGSAGSGASAMCRSLETASSELIADVVRDADLSCTTDDECEVVSNSTDCHAACGALVGPDGKRAIEAAVASENSGRCEGFEAMGCVLIIPPCVPPASGIRCAAGRCTSDDETPPAGTGGDSADAGVIDDSCFDQTLTFGWEGGFVAFQDRITLSPCNTYSVTRSGGRNPSADASCENEVAADAAIGVDAIDAALAEPEVQAAFAKAPQLFGVDTRPVDGAVYQIELDGSAIQVGQPCGSSGGLGGPCTEIPAAVSELVSALQDLVAQQMALADCEQLP